MSNNDNLLRFLVKTDWKNQSVEDCKQKNKSCYELIALSFTASVRSIGCQPPLPSPSTGCHGLDQRETLMIPLFTPVPEEVSWREFMITKLYIIQDPLETAYI